MPQGKAARKLDVGISGLIIILSHAVSSYKSYDYINRDIEILKKSIRDERENRQLYYVTKSDLIAVKQDINSVRTDIHDLKNKMSNMNNLLESENEIDQDELLTELENQIRSRI